MYRLQINNDVFQAALVAEQFLQSDAWILVKKILEEYEKSRGKDMQEYLGTDPIVIKQRQMSWRIVKEIRLALEQDLNAAVSFVKEQAAEKLMEKN